MARSYLCIKASLDPHDIKYPAAAFEDASLASAEWRPYLLAASVHAPEVRTPPFFYRFAARLHKRFSQQDRERLLVLWKACRRFHQNFGLYQQTLKTAPAGSCANNRRILSRAGSIPWAQNLMLKARRGEGCFLRHLNDLHPRLLPILPDRILTRICPATQLILSSFIADQASLIFLTKKVGCALQLL